MLRHTHRRRLLATVATVAALLATAPAALAMPIDGSGSASTMPASPEPVRVVRVQVDQGLDWVDAGVGAAAMLALVLVGFGAAHTLTSPTGRGQSAAHS